MSEQDPKRLLDALDGGDLRAMLEAGKSETPDDARMMMLAAKIGGAGAAGAGGAGAGAGAGGGAGAGAAGTKAAIGTATAVKAGLAMKVVGAIAIAGAVGGGAVVVRHATRPAESAMAPAGMVAQPPSTIAPRAAAASNASPSATTLAVADPFASAPARSSAIARAAKPTPSSSSSASPEDTSPSAELALLERAQDALRSRPADALALCSDHARRFPRGAFVQEREVIAIEALAKTGRMSEARARADRFRQSFPGSANIRRIDAILGG